MTSASARFASGSTGLTLHHMKYKRPPLRIQPTTLWDYPSQDYGEGQQGRPGYKGATPSYIIWNLLQRYTRERDLVIDPFAGSGTTLDVARDLNRKALGYDVHPTRKDIFNVDARKLPPELSAKVDFVFMDPPYSTHLDYGPDPRDIGKLDAADDAYYLAMEQVFDETRRVLKPGGYMGLYVSDSYVHGSPGQFHPIGFELFARLRQRLTPVDIVSVIRHNKTLEMGNYRKAAEEGNFYLRGFNYLFIFRKDDGGAATAGSGASAGAAAASVPPPRKLPKAANRTFQPHPRRDQPRPKQRR